MKRFKGMAFVCCIFATAILCIFASHKGTTLNSVFAYTNEPLPVTAKAEPYLNLRVANTKANTQYAGNWRHLDFIKEIDIRRADGRPIYNYGGQWTNENTIIDWPCEIYIRTDSAQYKTQSGNYIFSKFEYGASIWVEYNGKRDYFPIHDLDGNYIGAGEFNNTDINPAPEYFKILEFDPISDNLRIGFSGTAYWQNGTTSESGDRIKIDDAITATVPLSVRDFDNYLIAPDGTPMEIVDEIPTYYLNKPTIIQTTNWNNHVKIDDVLMTPMADKTVVPNENRGLDISIYNEGITWLDIEHLNEFEFATHNILIDTQIPDIIFSHESLNPLGKAITENVKVDSQGNKSQIISNIYFNNAGVRVEFCNTKTQSPQYAFYTFDGDTFDFNSGTRFYNAGAYSITVANLAGHSKTINFIIDKKRPTENLTRLAQQTNYKVSKWYVAQIPSSYNGGGSYSFPQYQEAFDCAIHYEYLNRVTELRLNAIDDFHYNNLLAPSNTPRIGDYWYYKSLADEKTYLYYFDENALNAAIQAHANKLVRGANYFNPLMQNDYGSKIDNSMYDAIWRTDEYEAYIANDFIFKTTNDIESYRLYYAYLPTTDSLCEWVQFQYNQAFGKQVKKHGLYLIKEQNFAGNETYYYVFVDLESLVLTVKVRNENETEYFTHTISSYDIPLNNSLIYYYRNFTIENVFDDDMWWVLTVQCPDRQTLRFTYVDTLPDFKTIGAGEYTFTLYDRLNNRFTFKLVLSVEPVAETIKPQGRWNIAALIIIVLAVLLILVIIIVVLKCRRKVYFVTKKRKRKTTPLKPKS